MLRAAHPFPAPYDPLSLAAAALLAALCTVSCTPAARPIHNPAPRAVARSTADAAPLPWLKGQLHLHTDSSSDSNTPAESVVTWYAQRGYDFIVITDHNFVTHADSTPTVLVFPGVEITQNYGTCFPVEGSLPCRIHVNALFVEATSGSVSGLLPPAGDSPGRVERYLAAMDLTRTLQGVAQINHPNFRYSAGLPVLRELLRHGTTLLEIANQSFDVDNEGDASHPSTEAMWDALWTEGFTVWGTATDDAHHYDDAAELRAQGEDVFIGDLGWVMVRAERAEASIRDAIRLGHFYASNGVMLSVAEAQSDQLHVVVAPSSERRHVIQFVGDGGRELARAHGNEAAFNLALPGISYVRAVVTDDRGRKAWVQPVRLAR